MPNPSGAIERESMTLILTSLIRVYRVVIAPLLPPNTCRFYPTCSQYALDAIAKYGPARGLWMAVKRIGRCHPFHPGGYDPA